ncbi:uncharacterized protein LOC123472419 [Daphnia magna]|uniref:uncharacterized protein LOC123472419 n=1 Tax=Daphnia magna TaxID=35525 RepID=UPI001E1BAE46|nr:uncharacterized protein LOC123472419 [Daphnia magna]
MDLNLNNSKLQYEEEEVLLSTLNGVVITGDLLPILDDQTRWSSTYYFLKRSLRLKNAINEIAKDWDLRKNELQPGEWEIVKEIFEFFKSFAIITTYIEATKYPTLFLVVHMYKSFWISSKKCQRTEENISLIQEGAQAGLKKLSSYYEKSSPLVKTATFMDARCRMNYFLVNDWNVGAELTNS